VIKCETYNEKRKEYETIAKKLLSRFGPYIYRNPDYIDTIVSYLFTSDSKYDPSKGTLETWRFGALNRAVKKILRENKKAIKRNSKSTPITENTVCNKNPSPLNQILENEMVTKRRQVIAKLLAGPALTKTERLYITEYYINGLKQDVIGEKYGVTFQAVSVTMLTGLKKLRAVYAGKEIYN
jgi:RNA polymerase sigma factor (sigma-70 family)